ncbi:MAG: type II secretion system GspH family protein [Lentisphaeraceae bacterium]|nr:type II secretion system GspH family protein [Lentisphaeraceae bacterium]
MVKFKFTLIELLVVVAIIGILASLLMPSLHKARDAAKTAVCVSNQKQVGISVVMYATDFDGKIPPAGNQFVNLLGGPNYLDAPRSTPFNNNLEVEVQTNFNIFHCPAGLSDKLSKHAISGNWDAIDFTETLRAWRSSSNNTLNLAGGYDSWFSIVGVASRGDGNSNGWGYSNWRINNPTTDVWPSLGAISDAGRATVLHDGTHHMHSHKGDGSRISARHNGYKKTNVLFYDGHVITASRSRVFSSRYKDLTSDSAIVFKAAKYP